MKKGHNIINEEKAKHSALRQHERVKTAINHTCGTHVQTVTMNHTLFPLDGFVPMGFPLRFLMRW
jgi:hypothetical protein